MPMPIMQITRSSVKLCFHFVESTAFMHNEMRLSFTHFM